MRPVREYLVRTRKPQAADAHAAGALARAARDPVLWTLLITLASAILWLVYAQASPLMWAWMYWVIQCPFDGALGVFSWRVARMGHGAPRTFWLLISTSGLLWCAGDISQTLTVPLESSSASLNGGVVQTVLFVVGILIAAAALVTYPTKVRSGRERLAFWLDAATIMVGGVVLAWCFAADSAARSSANLVVTLGATGAMVTATYAGIKVLLSPQAPLTRAAATPMILAALLQGASMLWEPTVGAVHDVPALALLRLLPSALLAVGPRIHELQAKADPGGLVVRRPSPYTLVPYVAIAAVFAALLAILPGGVNARLWGVAVGAAVVTALVLGRQFVAFTENVSLVRRLDATLVELREHEKRLLDQASVDGLTRLANRAVLGAEITRALQSVNGTAGTALLLIDLDDFKNVNDSLGHPAGDALLVTVAGMLRTSAPDADLVARVGGDEFAVLLRDVTEEQAVGVAERILQRLARPVQFDGHELVVQASVGLAVAAPGDDVDSLFRNADIAMYEAKGSGKGVCARYVPDMWVRIRAIAELGSQLRDALNTDQLFLLYQPIVRLADGRLAGVEALLRWRHPERGLVSPVEFIPVAERSGMIVPLGRWVLREACRQAAAWRGLGGVTEPFVVSVNAAGRQLRERSFVDDVAAALAEFGLPPSSLTIEVTENAVLSDDVAIATLHGLRELGVSLALDDFGTGASSLGLLLTCPVTSLKLDRSFVESITTVNRQAAVATAVIEIASALNLKAVAEGVETPEQAHLLRQLSYEHAQGFLFARPLPPEELARLMIAERDPAAVAGEAAG